MGSNVFNIMAGRRRQDFTAAEKTLLGDVAMRCRDNNIHAKLVLNEHSLQPLARFIDYDTGKAFMYVTKHHEKTGDHYEFVPIGKTGMTLINFADVLAACRLHIENMHGGAKVLDMGSYRHG